jgi:hypothetical protein
VKLLREWGNSLRRPQSGALGEGLFELRGKEAKTLERVRGYQREVMRRKRGSRQEKKR